MKRISKYLYICCCMLLVHAATAQADLRQDSAFFDETLSQLKDWMEATNIAAACSVEGLQIEAGFVALHLQTPDAPTWLGLRESYREQTGASLERDLFHKFIFQMELPYDSAFVTLRGKGYYANVGYPNGEWTVEEPEFKGAVEGKVKVKLSQMPVHGHLALGSNAVRARELLGDYLKDFYQEKGTFWSTARQRWIKHDNRFILEITNIKSEVLDDFFFGYYEFISINAHITERDGEVVVDYSLQGKYGSGLFSAPRRGGYYDMDPKYLDYLQRYNQKLSLEMSQALKKKVNNRP